jgi:hypothetical protein
MIPRPVLASWITLAGALLLLPQDSATFDTRGYPAEMVEAGRLTERRCTKCHSLTRIVDTPFVGDDWVDVVQSMAKKEKSGISEPEAATISKFLAYRSTHVGGGAAAGGAKEAAASRPTVFGETAAYPLPGAAVYASAPLPAAASLPATLDLAGTKVIVRSASTESGAAGLARAAAGIAVNDVEHALDLARSDGKFTSSGLTLRTWSIGPHALRLEVALYRADPAVPGEARGDLVLALLVVREAKPSAPRP